ncbi:MAG: nickel-dependent hydrogenase large subunit [Thiohalocapsa sp.]|nr:nickel-dependent hydrogenase large subunit [Thiohalocapsa sp.]MCF7989419.1 nickel-dependent hydrogenase large subunit [Thiohalocapsa sp.]
MTEQRTRRIDVPVLARVEGEGALEVTIRDGRIAHLALRIFEPPRLFERFLVGHHYSELPDLVARICGICPVAYQMSALDAIERLFAPDRQSPPARWVQRMRRLFYCGEWMQSHALHIHLLAAPDFLGFDSAPAMAARYGAELRRGLALQALGNRIISLFGARSVHPVGARAGGFRRAPSLQQAGALAAQAEQAVPAAEDLVRWTAALPLPAHPQQFNCVSLRHPAEYPMIGERIVAESGLDISVDDFEDHITEFQVPHSTALHALLEGKPYLVGPLARLNLNLDRLHPGVKALLAELDIEFPSHDMYHSIVARAVEILQALLEAREILADYAPQEPAHIDLQPRAGIARGASEAPRGLLWHRYDLDSAGIIAHARIVPPTSQNQPRIEADLADALVGVGLDEDEATLRHAGEMVIRNYDPCISCATHFLRLTLDR